MTHRLLIVTLAAFALVFAAGCDAINPKTVSPFSGQLVDANQLSQEALRWDAEQRSADLAEQADAEGKLRRLRSEASLDARKLINDFDTSLARLQATAELGAQDVIEKLALSQRSRDLQIESMQRLIDSAAADLDRQQAQRMAVWSAVQSIPGVDTVPGFGAIAGIVTGLLGAGAVGAPVVLTQRKKAKAAEEKARETEAAAESVVSSIDVLKDKDETVAAAFKANAKLLDEWQGEAGRALVQRLQLGKTTA